jgi:hypothetical protein
VIRIDLAAHESDMKIGREVVKLIPVWLFFFLTFSLLRVTQSVALEGEGLRLTSPSLVLVGSLIVAKAFLVMDVFKFMNRYDHRPIIYGVLWKSGIYWLCALVVFYVEQFAELLLRHDSLAHAQRELFSKMDTPHSGITLVWLALLIFVFCATRELEQVLGKKRFMQMWFGTSIRSEIREQKKVA